ncbi:MAG: UDP-N-acetylmuramate dehydrogenase [Clostridia bacterium]|nr:UDP-N-acetylmuramate dehydrogenase [Clostridia bacterium]
MITWYDICKKIDQYNGNLSDGKKKIEYKTNEPMSRHTTFRIGGSAALYTNCFDVSALQWLIHVFKEEGVKCFILGNGSNVLFPDAGYDGAVIDMTSLHQVKRDGTILYCEAGCSLTALARFALECGLTGLEFAYGIPGTCGGGMFMNAGAYDGEMSFVVKESTYIDSVTGEMHTLRGKEHEFSYRHSIYHDHPEWIIVSAVFSLAEGSKEEISAKMEDFLSRRKSKQPLEYPNAGSVFKRYPGRYTAKMIDEAGLKGYRIGDAQVSEKHAGFIVNRGNATCADVVALIEYIKGVISEKYGIQIECEIIQVK